MSDKNKKGGEKSITAGIPEVSAILVEEGLTKKAPTGEKSITAGIAEVSAILVDEGRSTLASPAPTAPPPLPKKKQMTQMGVAPPANVPAAPPTTPSVEGTFPPPQKKSSSSSPPPRADKEKDKNTTLIGSASPPPAIEPIVPRRRTPMAGMPAVNSKTLIGGAAAPLKAPLPAPPPEPKFEEKRASDAMVPPVIRLSGGGGPPPPPSRRSGSLLCEILVRNGEVTQEMVDKAIAQQEEHGGQIGRILVSLGGCTEEAVARGLLEQLRIRKKTGYDTDISVAARENKDVAGLKVLTRPSLTVAVLLVTDIISLLLAAFLASSVHWIRTYGELGQVDWSSWLVVGPGIALCLLTFLGLELYSPMAKSTPDEIRDVVFAASLVHLMASLLSTLGDLPIVKWGVFVRGVWWMATLFIVPVARSFVRNKLSVYAWWGIPVCVLGAAKTGRLIVRTLKAQPRSGLKPVMMLDDDPSKHGTLRASYSNEQMDVYSVNVSNSNLISDQQRKALTEDIFGAGAKGDEEVPAPVSSDHIPISQLAEFLGPESKKPSKVQPRDASLWPRGKFAEVEGVPVIGDLTLAPVLAQRLKIPYAVVAMPGVDSQKLVQIVERIGGKFSHLLIIPDLFGFATMGVPAKSLGGILGVEVRQQLLLPGPRLAKRVMDSALTGIGVLFVLPFLLIIAALIKIDSRGPIFYTQKRLGKDGEHFKAYKFRTMHGDGEERLKAILDADPQLRAEYEIYHKLKKDPRVTRIGRVLRKFSLDEFPQLLNVIKGDMSLVGPRPYIERELTEMGGQEKIILRAPPGMTGMWQVSDRNATSFAQRVQIDVYYVRNWSPWLDIHILAKTFGVVIKGSGV